MTEPLLGQFPSEIFGYPSSDVSEEAQAIRAQQHCPFLNSECKKPRKSEPKIKVGICSVGYRVESVYQPVIVCPHRFDTSVIRQTIVENNFFDLADYERIQWASEVSIGATTGSIDYVAARIDTRINQIVDYVCVELQAAGTTGTAFQAVKDLREHGRFQHQSYKYGINWANEFAKTMMQQAYKKGLILESWGKKLIFILQDVGLGYLERNYDINRLRNAQSTDAIHFYTIGMVWNPEIQRWKQHPVRRVSTDSQGVQAILGGIDPSTYPQETEFISKIASRLR